MKVVAMIRKGVNFSRTEDKFLASELYFLYMIICFSNGYIYKYLLLGKGCQVPVEWAK